MGAYRYLLRLPDGRLDPTLGYLTPEGIAGHYSPDDPHNPRDRRVLAVGTRIRSEKGEAYEVVGKARRNIPDLVIGVLFVRPVDATTASAAS